jgi:hypothetical protein
MVALGMVIGALCLPTGVYAKPKKPLANGCSMSQIQTNFGNSCVDQMEQDILSNKPYTHALLCNGGEMLCCTYDNATNQIQTCRKPAGTRLMPGMKGDIAAQGSLGIQRRGIEGSSSDNEEAPVPTWMTEERLKALQMESKR